MSKTADPRPTDHRPRPWRDEPDFVVPELASVGLGRIAPELLSRHVLITGETGSGKTDSAIRPLLRAVMCYPDADAPPKALSRALRPSILLMDPKGDLTPDARRENRRRRLGRRIVALGAGSPRVVHLFEGLPPGSLGVDELVARLLVLSPSHHAERTRTNSAFFILQATVAFRSMLAADRAIFAAHGVPGLRAFWRDVAARVRAELGSAPQGMQYERVAYFKPHEHLVTLVATHRELVVRNYIETSVQYGAPQECLLALGAWLTMRDETVSAIVATMHNFLQDLGGALATRVSFNPFEAPPPRQSFSVRRALDEGWLVALSPNPHDPVEVTTAVAVKGLYFAHAFTRRVKERPFVFIADEAQLVLTTDASAEHGFLDRCRAYRCAVILATQGISSLRLRLNALGSEQLAQPALDILVTNCATKLWFRATDPEGRAVLRSLLPGPELAHKPHVVDVCPPSVLQTGECYVLSPRMWSRGRATVARHHLASSSPPARSAS